MHWCLHPCLSGAVGGSCFERSTEILLHIVRVRAVAGRVGVLRKVGSSSMIWNANMSQPKSTIAAILLTTECGLRGRGRRRRRRCVAVRAIGTSMGRIAEAAWNKCCRGSLRSERVIQRCAKGLLTLSGKCSLWLAESHSLSVSGAALHCGWTSLRLSVSRVSFRLRLGFHAVVERSLTVV